MAKLTFQTLCPQWDKALTAGSKINRKLNMNEWDRCIVGEARGFSTFRVCGCKDCIDIAQAFTSVTSGKQRIKILNQKEFESIKDKLVAHVSKEHD